MPVSDATAAPVMCRAEKAYTLALRRSKIIEDEDAWDVAERDRTESCVPLIIGRSFIRRADRAREPPPPWSKTRVSIRRVQILHPNLMNPSNLGSRVQMQGANAGCKCRGSRVQMEGNKQVQPCCGKVGDLV